MEWFSFVEWGRFFLNTSLHDLLDIWGIACDILMTEGERKLHASKQEETYNS